MKKNIAIGLLLFLCIVKISYATNVNEDSALYPNNLTGYKDEGERSIRRGIIKGVSLQQSIIETDNTTDLEKVTKKMIQNEDFFMNEIGNYFLTHKDYQGYILIQEHFYMSKTNNANVSLTGMKKDNQIYLNNLVKENMIQNNRKTTWSSSYFIIKYIASNQTPIITKEVETNVLEILNKTSKIINKYSIIELESENFYAKTLNMYGLNGSLINEQDMKKIQIEIENEKNTN